MMGKNNHCYTRMHTLPFCFLNKYFYCTVTGKILHNMEQACPCNFLKPLPVKDFMGLASILFALHTIKPRL